ncbi:MAG: hypothetical protein F6K37_24875 [Moorea sp. SIO4E2]|uniref:hypothetical protein n=1 Tax=Moorena sp. SIO4E2 TaxID=2607826 RepID=UPI0013BDA6E7|nr:hypothetical protein [Moorena sp. SIO4E2]NEQ09058.1 hypothetical protein [Moorena sp. SIO4E2]
MAMGAMVFPNSRDEELLKPISKCISRRILAHLTPHTSHTSQPPHTSETLPPIPDSRFPIPSPTTYPFLPESD